VLLKVLPLHNQAFSIQMWKELILFIYFAVVAASAVAVAIAIA
jgi:hypothetical protein